MKNCTVHVDVNFVGFLKAMASSQCTLSPLPSLFSFKFSLYRASLINGYSLLFFHRHRCLKCNFLIICPSILPVPGAIIEVLVLYHVNYLNRVSFFLEIFFNWLPVSRREPFFWLFRCCKFQLYGLDKVDIQDSGSFFNF